MSRFGSLEVIQRTLTTSFIEAILDGAMAVVTLGVMLFDSWKLAAIVCAAAVLYGLLRLVWYRPLRQAQEEQSIQAAKQQSNFLETVRGVQSVKLFNHQMHRQTLYQNLLVNNFNAGIRVQKLNIPIPRPERRLVRDREYRCRLVRAAVGARGGVLRGDAVCLHRL